MEIPDEPSEIVAEPGPGSVPSHATRNGKRVLLDREMQHTFVEMSYNVWPLADMTLCTAHVRFWG